VADTDKNTVDHSWLEDDDDGQLAIDVYQTPDDIIIIAPIAGVAKEDLDLAINDEMVTVKGKRKHPEFPEEHELLKECYWGNFSRNYILPVAVNADSAVANLRDGLLTITIPKDEKSKAKSIKFVD
jgi:HSP20 family protein